MVALTPTVSWLVDPNLQGPKLIIKELNVFFKKKYISWTNLPHLLDGIVWITMYFFIPAITQVFGDSVSIGNLLINWNLSNNYEKTGRIEIQPQNQFSLILVSSKAFHCLQERECEVARYISRKCCSVYDIYIQRRHVK